MNSSTILLVDDRPENLLALEHILEDFDVRTVTANSGAEALKRCVEEEFALILLDVQMPEMDGFETAELLRSLEKTRSLPIIFVTAISKEQRHIFRGYESGAVDYLFKPIDPHILKSKVRVFLELDQNKREIAKAHNELQELHAQILEELEEARGIQLSLLPRQMPQIPGCRLAAKYKPMQHIGGDLYDFFELDDQHLGILLADVSGHGISAALLCSMMSGLFKTFAPKKRDVVSTIRAVNNALLEFMPEGKFSTVFYCIYNLQNNSLIYASMGHPPGFLVRPPAEEIITLPQGGIVLGMFPNHVVTLDRGLVSLQSGDRLLLYTDGILEVSTDDFRMYGFKRIKEFLLNHQNLTIEEIIDSLYADALAYSGQPDYNDDVTLVGLQVT